MTQTRAPSSRPVWSQVWHGACSSKPVMDASRTLLVVDDDVAMRQMLGSLFRDRGFRTVLTPPDMVKPYYDRLGLRREGASYALDIA